MKIALLSDIHGNYIALETTLKHAENIGVNYFIILGDLIGYYHQAEKVVDKIKSLPGIVIQGNHERLLQKVLNGELSIEELTEKYGEGHKIAMQSIKREELEWLISLPFEKDVIIDNISIKLCHGAPGKPDYYIYPDLEQTTFLEFCDDAYDFIFIGHTHYPFIFNNGNCTLINVGSVGQSKDVGGLATWGVLDTYNKTYMPYRTPYDLNHFEQEVKSINNRNQKYLLSVLKRNRYDN